MKSWTKIAFMAAILVAETLRAGSPALAHRFGVALVIPLSGTASLQGRQYREGFMLATTERDSHPDEESDGHLGGLDVYVSDVDTQGDVTAKLKQTTDQNDINIVTALGSQNLLSSVGSALSGTGIVLLPPGQTPFSTPGSPAVAAFSAAYEKTYNAKPSPQAAQGYNAARRIEAAVRALEGVDDAAALQQMFAQSARNFTWQRE